MKGRVRMVKLKCLSNKRKYITRQSTNSTGNGWLTSIGNPKTQTVNGGIITRRISKAKNDKSDNIHPYRNTKVSLLNDSKNAITNVKPSVFKYSKCRTCRIPCNAEFFKKRDFKVKVVHIDTSKCLELSKDSNISSFEEDRSKSDFIDNEIEDNEKQVNKYNGHNQGKNGKVSPRSARVLRGYNKIINCAVAKVPIKSKVDNLTDNLSIENEKSMKKTDIGIKELSCMSSTNNSSDIGNLSSVPSNCHIIDLNIEQEDELKHIAATDNGCLPNNEVIDLNEVVVLNNGDVDLKNEGIGLKNGVCDVNNRVSDVKNFADQHKSHDVIMNGGHDFSMELHLPKYTESNKKTICNDTRDLSGAQNIASKKLPETDENVLSYLNHSVSNTSQKDMYIDSNGCASSNNVDENNKHMIDDVDITFYNGSSSSTDTDSPLSSEDQINLVNGSNEYVLSNEEDNSKTPSVDENDNFIDTECESPLLQEIIRENGIVGNLETNDQYQEHTDNQFDTSICVVSDHSKCISNLNRNGYSDNCREHILINNRKHVRLKEKDEGSLYSSSHGLLDNESFTYYLFESTKRLKFLHNHFYAPVVEPDEDILQSMLENIELDIEIFDEDCYISNNKDGVVSRCKWNECNMQFNNSGHLLDHLRTTHIEPISNRNMLCCLWRKCKFSNHPSSYKWLSNHVLKHCSVRPFRCVILGCELSFATQNGLARHVPTHFNEGKVRRTCVLTGVGKNEEDVSRTKTDTPSSSMDNKSEDNEEASEPIRKKTRYEKFVDRYKATGTVNNGGQNGLNGIKYKLQISTCNSSVSCGYVGPYFRFNHKVIGKRTSKDGSTDMLLSPSSKKIFPYKSFWFDGNTLARQESLFVDISVNNLSDDVKQHLYDNEQVSQMNNKGKRGM